MVVKQINVTTYLVLRNSESVYQLQISIRKGRVQL